jgi:hypothetical protein
MQAIPGRRKVVLVTTYWRRYKRRERHRSEEFMATIAEALGEAIQHHQAGRAGQTPFF